MVKHQRRSHQRGIHSSELDDGETSESDSGDSPTTPEHYGQIQWLQNMKSSTPHPIPQHVHTFQRAHSYSDFDHPQASGYGMTPTYSSRTNASDYTDASSVHDQMVVPRAAPQHSYYVPEQGNPGVATMNTNPNLPVRQYQLVPQNHLQRSISYPPQSVPSVTSSPGTYSTVSCRSPMPQEVYYTHHPVQPTSAYTSPVDQQPMIRYTQTPPMSQAPPQALVSSTPMLSHVQDQYQQAQAEQNWYANSPYQEPLPISPVPCGEPLYNPWLKMDNFGDIQHALPSVRIETL